MTWFSNTSSRDATIAQSKVLAEPFKRFYSSFWQLPYIPAQTLELCRLRIAALHQCDAEWQREEVSLAGPLRDELSQWNKSQEFSAAEKAALAFTEVYTMDPQSISDDHADAVKAHYGDAGLVALIEALGVFYGLTRVAHLWDLSPEEGKEVYRE